MYLICARACICSQQVRSTLSNLCLGPSVILSQFEFQAKPYLPARLTCLGMLIAVIKFWLRIGAQYFSRLEFLVKLGFATFVAPPSNVPPRLTPRLLSRRVISFAEAPRYFALIAEEYAQQPKSAEADCEHARRECRECRDIRAR